MTLLEKANLLSPIACRLLARKNNGHTAKTYEDIARECGLSVSTVKGYSRRPNWDGIPINNVVSFAAACGVDHMQPEKQIHFLKHRKWEHIADARNPKQRQMFKRILGVDKNAVV